jgi:membrane dipeptidase
MFDQLEAELETKYSAYAKIVRCGKDLETLTTPHVESEKRRIAVVHTLEGGHALGGKLEALDEFAQRGVAMITVTHFFYKGIGTSANSIPFFPDAGAADPTVGLSSYGRDVVAKMEELKMIVDIAHATAPTVADILKMAKRPLIASHTAARTLGNHPYSMVDEHIQEVARRGGVIGVILMPYWLSNYSTVPQAENKGTLREVVRTVQYIYKITGKHTCIGIGSDFGGFITGPKGMTALSQIDELRGLLLQEFNPDQVEDIMANNVIDFFKEHWGER